MASERDTPEQTDCIIPEQSRVFRGLDAECDSPRPQLSPPPKWRDLSGGRAARHKGRAYRASPHEIDMVNAALHLRRPLLVTGPPGVGKSSLAHAVAHELGWGDALVWAITSRSTREHGLYSYDAVARFQAVALAAKQRELLDLRPHHRRPRWRSRQAHRAEAASILEIGRYIKLGPLGTAFLSSGHGQPRVLLIDELDKSNIDLPNDLLHLFEDGYFEIPEIARLPDDQRPTDGVEVRGYDGQPLVVPADGLVRCGDFPLVVITSNGEREFPPAFQRRCLRLVIREPDGKRLRAIIAQHLDLELPDHAEDASTPEGQGVQLLELFETLRKDKALATDQLLNALHLVKQGIDLTPGQKNRLRDDILSALAEL
jgi:MoxR-like ATPase